MIGVETSLVSEIASSSAKCGGTITGDVGDYKPLVDRLLNNKFQLFHRSRQKISSQIQNEGSIKPFQMFTDSKQASKPFLIASYQYNVTDDSYEVEIFEYDNTTVITNP